MAKINNLAIPARGGGGGPDPLSPPLDPPMLCTRTRGSRKQLFGKEVTSSWDTYTICGNQTSDLMNTKSLAKRYK